MRHLFVCLCIALCWPAFSQNNKPVITGQKELKTPQNEPVTVTLGDLSVTDSAGDAYPDYPTGFTLELFAGDNYSFSGTTVTPAQNFAGSLTVPVRVNDGNRSSDKFNLVIEVYKLPNTPPVIVGQVALSVNAGASLTITFSDLFVTDPDDNYPEGFTLTVTSGVNYTVNGTSVTPVDGFAGTLAVPVTVNDGEADSPPFNLSITVTPPPVNVPPVITGQNTLSTLMDQAVTITLAHLLVTDPDNAYPDDFSLTVVPGANYTVSGASVTPAPGFTGTLTISVTVSDGVSASNVFPFRLDVIEPAVLTITSQKPLQTEEDTPLEIALSDLIVNDPENRYPSGFQLVLGEGTGYSVSGRVITPAQDLNGNLDVNVYVADPTRQSEPFRLTISVVPVNDAPVIEGIPETPIQVLAGSDVPLFPGIVITDVDNETMSFAEISFAPGSYQRNGDELYPATTNESLRVVFDPAEGTLFIIGSASVSEYTSVLRSIRYRFNESDSLEARGPKVLEVVVSDGQLRSEVKQVTIEFIATGELDIPTVFTPNGDNANDTWRIGGLQGDLNGQVRIRVFDGRGFLIYEAGDLSNPWDGKRDGTEVPGGTYFYTIELDLPSASRQYQGVVTILR